jgi:hypothetical protein
MEKEKTGMDFEDEPGYEKRAGIFKRIGLVCILAVVAAAASGLLGYGIGTNRSIRQRATVISYEYFLHVTKETPLKIRAEINDSVGTVSFNTDYFNKVQITDILPKPFKVFSDNGNTTFHFLIKKRGDQEFIFNTKAVKAGKSDAFVSVGQQFFSINQFIYP